MSNPLAVSRRRPALMVVVALTVAVIGAGAAQWWRTTRDPLRGQSMSIGDRGSADASAPWPRLSPDRPGPSHSPAPDQPAFLTSVSDNGRYFLDQYGQPFLVRGDSPWALMTRLSPEEAQIYLADRERHGFNSLIVSLLGAEANGGPSDDGSTLDGLRPFVEGDVVDWQELYWQRMEDYLRLAAEHGITVFLYPIDGWVVGTSFVPSSIDRCRDYGAKVAQRFRKLPNIVWMSGGDYTPGEDAERGSDVDRCIDALMRGIRGTGDGRPFSIQLWYDKSISTESPFWARRADWNFAYSYYPTYKAVLDAYRHEPAIPVLFGEGNYEGENNQPDTPATTDETLRRQVLWALTSGAAGDFMGSDDWEFHDGWQQRLSTPGVEQVSRLRDLFSELPWWALVPDLRGELVTSGRGERITADRPLDVLDNDYATAARSRDGRYAVVYVPTARTLTLDLSLLADDVSLAWVDPSSGARSPVERTPLLTTPGSNDAGGSDWLLVTEPREVG